MSNPLIPLIFSTISSGMQARSGAAAKAAADLDAFNIETQREVSKAEALQRHNDRLEQYRANTRANVAVFFASGADVRPDKSVGAFLNRQQEIATQDTKRSDLMGFFEQMKLTQQATATRVEGRAQKQAAMIGAFNTMAKGIMTYQDTIAEGIGSGANGD